MKNRLIIFLSLFILLGCSSQKNTTSYSKKQYNEYSECIKGGIDMDKKELFEKGVNDSLVHVDFMMGTEDLMIDGILEDGSHVKIFENGNFVF